MISIITCSYNRAEQLKRGIESFVHQRDGMEIIVVDDGSTDNTKEVVQKLTEKNQHNVWNYIYLNHPEPRISCIPRNIGIREARGDIIIFTEPEALHVGNTISQLLDAMQEHPENTILASQVWTMGMKAYEGLSEDFFAQPERIIKHPFAMLTDAEHPQNTKAFDADYAITGEKYCNAGILFATRKEWLLKVGGFDESFEGHGFDDFDLFNRLALIGHGVIKYPAIAVIHQYHDKSFYKYNIYEAANRNGKISEANIHAGIYEVNRGKEWGKIE